MATELTKYQLVPTDNHNIVTHFSGHFSLFKSKKSYVFLCGVLFVFIGVTVFLAFSPSNLTSTSSWFNFFTLNYTSPSSVNPSRSQDTSQTLTNTQLPSDKVENFEQPINQISTNLPKISPISSNQDQNFEPNTKNLIDPEKPINQISTNLPQISPISSNQDQNFEPNTTNLIDPEKPIDQISTNLPQISPVSSNQDQNFELTNTDKVENFESNTSNSIIPKKPINQITTNLPQDENFELINTNNDTNLPQISSEFEKVEHNDTNLSSVVLPKIPPQSPKSSANSTVETVSSKGQEGKYVVSNITVSLSKKPDSNNGNDTVLSEDKKEGKNLVSSLVGCDLYDGEWVRDELYPLYKPGSCKFIDEQFSCKLNGRVDDDYQKLKWKPKGCTLPRLNGRKMLKLLRGKRLVFVGDSLNRNMWESLVCILKNSVKNPKNVHEAHGRHNFRNVAAYSFVFEDYNCTVEFFVAPFLVRPWEVKDKNGTTKETLRLDVMAEESEHFKTADVIIFNTGHWWTHEKTSKGEDYYQERNKVYKQLDVQEAFRKAIATWGRWVVQNINPQRTHVFFRGYSNTHFHGGQWNSGGKCESETEPIRNETYLTHYPWKMEVFEKVVSGMKLPISYLNITRMTDYRKDAHPSIYRKQKLSGEEKKAPLKFQDCSHWCLPGVPDLWNELLYAEMLRKKYQDQQQT